MDLLVDGDTTYKTTGVVDTQTPRSDGPAGSDVASANVDGIAKAVVDLQNLLGNALTLIGTAGDLATRLARSLAADGAIAKGLTFPISPVPIDGQPFYRVDLDTPFWYNAATGTWLTAFGTQAGIALPHSSLSGLSADDHTIYGLISGARDWTAGQKFKSINPFLRLVGTETSAKDFRFVEVAGELQLQRNDGTEGSPTWTQIANFPSTVVGPSTTGLGSEVAHEGDITITSNQNLSGVHLYRNFTINAGVTVTVPAGGHCLVILSFQSITINGTINANGAGQAGGSAVAAGGGAGIPGSNGTDQSGGSGGTGQSGGGTGGSAVMGSITLQTAGNTSVTGNKALRRLGILYSLSGGAGGGSGGDPTANGASGGGGVGGGTVVLVAPLLTLGSSSAITCNGSDGGNQTSIGGAPQGGGGGGGGAGDIYLLYRSLINNGATFTLTGGAGGSGGVGATSGGAGANGVKHLLNYTQPWN